ATPTITRAPLVRAVSSLGAVTLVIAVTSATFTVAAKMNLGNLDLVDPLTAGVSVEGDGGQGDLDDVVLLGQRLDDGAVGVEIGSVHGAFEGLLQTLHATGAQIVNGRHLLDADPLTGDPFDVLQQPMLTGFEE